MEKMCKQIALPQNLGMVQMLILDGDQHPWRVIARDSDMFRMSQMDFCVQ